jgi:predicted  nucleic acid-binding Zn-ribbon protein
MVGLSVFASDASAQLFGGDDKKWERVLLEVKKLNTRIVEQVIPQFDKINAEVKQMKTELAKIKSQVGNVQSGSRAMNQNVDTLSNMIPGIQATMEQNQAQAMREMQALSTRIAELEGKIKAEQERQAQSQQATLDAIKQEVGANLQTLKDGMARDMEQIAKLNQGSFQDLIKNNEKHLNEQNMRVDKSIAVMTEMAKGGAKNSEVLSSLKTALIENSKALSEQNKKIIDILSKSLKEQETSSARLDVIGGNQSKADENVKITRETMVALKGILDKRLAEIDKTQQALMTQNDKAMQNTDLIKQNLLVADQKINKLAEGLKAIQTQEVNAGGSIVAVKDQLVQIKDINRQTDEKFAKLVDTTKTLAANAGEINNKVDASLQKLEQGKAEAELSSVKISKLIGILKAIAEEQGKLELLIASHGSKGDNKKILDALEDLRRKANVTISRNDSILQKLKGSK